mgnify:FL=1
MSAPVIFWFRRDLRLADNPALSAAVASGQPVVPVFIVDKEILAPAGPTRAAYLQATLESLAASLDGALVLRSGRPDDVLRTLAREVGATRVFATGDYANYGARRDRATASALAREGIELSFVSTPYAVAPGTITSKTDLKISN